VDTITIQEFNVDWKAECSRFDTWNETAFRLRAAIWRDVEVESLSLSFSFVAVVFVVTDRDILTL